MKTIKTNENREYNINKTDIPVWFYSFGKIYKRQLWEGSYDTMWVRFENTFYRIENGYKGYEIRNTRPEFAI